MSLFNTMRTSVSGMAAQSNALSAIGDNIANSSTTGYKEASAQFETLLGNDSSSSYESGGVTTDIRYGITDQGTLSTTTSATDLAIQGNGFFVVSNNGQGTYLTRAGSFVPDSNGNLVNAAGYDLMGSQIVDGKPSPSLSVVNVSAASLLPPTPSTSGTLAVNLPSTATAAAAGTTPADSTSSTTATVNYTDKTSMTVYDNLGTADVLDVYFTKTGDNTWEATAYQQSAATNGGFPYTGAAPGMSAALGSTSLTFDPKSGTLTAGNPLSINLSPPNGNPVALDLSATTQLATDFGVTTAQANGNAPSKLSSVKVGTDGTLTAVYANGTQVATYTIPVATVTSPDNLAPLNGNVYEISVTSGNYQLQAAGTNGAGTIQSDSLEQSTVDLATELTNMIVAQRGYEANSKVLQAASDMLSVLNRLTTN